MENKNNEKELQVIKRKDLINNPANIQKVIKALDSGIYDIVFEIPGKEYVEDYQDVPRITIEELEEMKNEISKKQSEIIVNNVNHDHFKNKENKEKIVRNFFVATVMVGAMLLVGHSCSNQNTGEELDTTTTDQTDLLKPNITETVVDFEKFNELFSLLKTQVNEQNIDISDEILLDMLILGNIEYFSIEGLHDVLVAYYPSYSSSHIEVLDEIPNNALSNVPNLFIKSMKSGNTINSGIFANENDTQFFNDFQADSLKVYEELNKIGKEDEESFNRQFVSDYLENCRHYLENIDSNFNGNNYTSRVNDNSYGTTVIVTSNMQFMASMITAYNDVLIEKELAEFLFSTSGNVQSIMNQSRETSATYLEVSEKIFEEINNPASKYHFYDTDIEALQKTITIIDAKSDLDGTSVQNLALKTISECYTVNGENIHYSDTDISTINARIDHYEKALEEYLATNELEESKSK